MERILCCDTMLSIYMHRMLLVGGSWPGSRNLPIYQTYFLPYSYFRKCSSALKRF